MADGPRKMKLDQDHNFLFNPPRATKRPDGITEAAISSTERLVMDAAPTGSRSRLAMAGSEGSSLCLGHDSTVSQPSTSTIVRQPIIPEPWRVRFTSLRSFHQRPSNSAWEWRIQIVMKGSQQSAAEAVGWRAFTSMYTSRGVYIYTHNSYR